MRVDVILKTKGSAVYTIKEKLQLAETASLLMEKRIGAVVVLDKAGSVCGVLSERDIIHAIAQEGQAALTKPVKDYMTSDVVTCRLNDTINHCMELMTDRRIRHLPVVEDGHLKGIISIGDVVKWRIAETDMEAQAMREYIASG